MHITGINIIDEFLEGLRRLQDEATQAEKYSSERDSFRYELIKLKKEHFDKGGLDRKAFDKFERYIVKEFGAKERAKIKRLRHKAYSAARAEYMEEVEK